MGFESGTLLAITVLVDCLQNVANYEKLCACWEIVRAIAITITLHCIHNCITKISGQKGAAVWESDYQNLSQVIVSKCLSLTLAFGLLSAPCSIRQTHPLRLPNHRVAVDTAVCGYRHEGCHRHVHYPIYWVSQLLLTLNGC